MCITSTFLFETRVDWFPETSKQPSNKSCEEENWNFRKQSKMYEKGESFSSKFSISKIHGEEASDIGSCIYCSLHNGNVLKTRHIKCETKDEII